VFADLIDSNDTEGLLFILPVYLDFQAIYAVDPKRVSTCGSFHFLKVQGRPLLQIMNIQGRTDGGYYFKESLYDLFLERIFLRPAGGIQRLKMLVNEVKLHCYRLVQPGIYVNKMSVLLHIDVDIVFTRHYFFFCEASRKKASPADIAE
jgi:hypothetical protein